MKQQQKAREVLEGVLESRWRRRERRSRKRRREKRHQGPSGSIRLLFLK